MMSFCDYFSGRDHFSWKARLFLKKNRRGDFAIRKIGAFPGFKKIGATKTWFEK